MRASCHRLQSFEITVCNFGQRDVLGVVLDPREAVCENVWLSVQDVYGIELPEQRGDTTQSVCLTNQPTNLTLGTLPFSWDSNRSEEDVPFGISARNFL